MLPVDTEPLVSNLQTRTFRFTFAQRGSIRMARFPSQTAFLQQNKTKQKNSNMLEINQFNVPATL